MKTKPRLGRPPRVDPNAEHFATALRPDVATYIRLKAMREKRWVSEVISELVMLGIAYQVSPRPRKAAKGRGKRGRVSDTRRGGRTC